MALLSLSAFIAAKKVKIPIHILEFDLWKWCSLLMVIFFGILGIIGNILDCEIGCRFDSNKMIHDLAHDFVRDNSVSVHILIVFIVWMSLFNRRVSSKTVALILHYITKTLAALLIGSCLWTLKTVLVVTVASKFRIKDFLEKIAYALSNKYLLKALSRPPPVMGPMTQEEDAAAVTVASKFRKDFLEKIADALSNTYLLKAFSRPPPVMGPMTQEEDAAAFAGGPYGAYFFRVPSMISEIDMRLRGSKISIITEFVLKSFRKRDKMYGLVVSEGSKGVEELRACVKRLITKKENKIIKGVSYRTLLFLTHNVLETELSIINNPIDDDIERQTDFKITNEWEAETAVDRIFSNLAKTDPKYMNADELLRILPKKDVKTLHSQVHGTDDSSDGRISKIALRQWVVFREHKALTSSSNYHKAVVKQLDQFMTCVLVLLVFIIWLLLIDYPTPRIQLLLSLLLGASFIFGNTCKNIFEGIIYVVIMHPFDIGDLCVVDDGQVLVVEGGDIYTTAFSDVDTDEKVFYPNSLLCSKPIKNYTRSPDMKETLKIIIDNPGQQLQDQKEFIERRIVEYLKSQPKQWQPCPVLYEMETVDAEKLTIVLHCFRKMSLQNWKERVSQKNMLKKEIKKITEELRLEFSVAEQATSSM